MRREAEGELEQNKNRSIQMPRPRWASHVIRRNETRRGIVLDLGQNRPALYEVEFAYRRAEARLAKHGSERPARRGSAYATNQSTAETWRGGTRGRHSERPRGDSRVEDNGPGPALVVDNTLDRYP